ncbi:MAG: DUF4386 family protein [Canidatus Methanoxibalbensis ujae]|nr:DUF4386 family protein [Candidatus Methanoxibalbensis ujae]
MSQLKLNPLIGVETADSRWNWLYRVAGVAALISLVIIPIQIIVFIVSPPPTTAIGWFTLFQNNELLGLLTFELLIVVSNALAIPIYLAFYAALRQVSESFMAIATVIGLVGIVASFVARPAFEMLYLSDQYAAATTDSQSMFLAAGEVMIAMSKGTASHLSYIFAALAPLIISVVMLRSNIFSKATAYTGILANVIALGFYVPEIGIIFGIISVCPFLMIWEILIARRFFQLGRAVPKEEANRIGGISR